jgi:glycerophosphoryl diester phosphodiesterase
MSHGCDGFEFDVRYTRDRRAVLCHDPKIGRMEVATTDYTGLERRRGYTLACLEDVLFRFGATAWLDIELKVSGEEEVVSSLLSAHRPQCGYVVSSFLPDVLLRLREIDPSLPLGYICERPEDAERWTSLPINMFIPQYSLVSRHLVDDVHARRMQVLTWTVNSREELLLLAVWGVDGLISDDPRLLNQAFAGSSATRAS